MEEERKRSIPLVQEQAVVRKRRETTDIVRVRTVVHRDEQVIADTVANESVEVTRVPVDRWVDAPVPVREEGDTIIISLHAEVPVVQLRMKVIEEVRITRRRELKPMEIKTVVRREEAVVERSGKDSDKQEKPDDDQRD